MGTKLTDLQSGSSRHRHGPGTRCCRASDIEPVDAENVYMLGYDQNMKGQLR